jgi:hypothetical protein
VSDKRAEIAITGSVNIAWAVRGVAGLCTAAGLCAAAVAISHVTHGDSIGIWLLPLCAGALTALVGVIVAAERKGSAIAWRVVAWRSAALVLLATYAFVLLPLLGFLTASILLILTVTLIYASNRMFVAVGGFIIAIGMWALFAYVLAEPLPGGLWWR